MIVLLAILWYLIGAFGGLLVSKKIHPVITNGDLVFLFTLGGIAGLLTVLIGLAYLPKGDWCNKRVL